MKLFRVKNSNTSWWIIAPTEDRAINFCLKHKFARAIENLKIIGDETNDNLPNASLQTLLDGSQVCSVFKEAKIFSFDEVLDRLELKASGIEQNEPEPIFHVGISEPL